MPGVMHTAPTPSGQLEKRPESGCSLCNTSIIVPTRRPRHAPVTMDGMKRPAGTADPNVKMVMVSVASAVSRR